MILPSGGRGTACGGWGVNKKVLLTSVCLRKPKVTPHPSLYRYAVNDTFPHRGRLTKPHLSATDKRVNNHLPHDKRRMNPCQRTNERHALSFWRAMLCPIESHRKPQLTFKRILSFATRFYHYANASFQNDGKKGSLSTDGMFCRLFIAINGNL